MVWYNPGTWLDDSATAAPSSSPPTASVSPDYSIFSGKLPVAVYDSSIYTGKAPSGTPIAQPPELRGQWPHTAARAQQHPLHHRAAMAEHAHVPGIAHSSGGAVDDDTLNGQVLKNGHAGNGYTTDKQVAESTAAGGKSANSTQAAVFAQRLPTPTPLKM